LDFISPPAEVETLAEEVTAEHTEIIDLLKQIANFIEGPLASHPLKQVRTWHFPCRGLLLEKFASNEISEYPCPAAVIPVKSSDRKQLKFNQPEPSRRTKAQLLSLDLTGLSFLIFNFCLLSIKSFGYLLLFSNYYLLELGILPLLFL
jgi:hypothetical protein